MGYMPVLTVQVFFSVSECVFFPSLELFFFSSFTEWKASGSFCKQVQQYIKGEQSTHKWKKFEWMMFGFFSATEREKRENVKTGGRRCVELWRKAERLTGQIFMQWSESSWWITCLSHVTSPQSELPFWSTSREHTSLHLSSSAQCGSLSDRPHKPLLSVTLVFLCFLPSVLPPRSVAPSGKAAACIESDSRVSILVLLSLL